MKNKSKIKLVFLAIILHTLSGSVISPVFSLYLQFIGINVSVIGFVVLTHSVTSGLFDPFSGELTDKIGKKRLIIFSFVSWSIINLLYIIPNFYWILLLRVLHGLDTAIISVCIWGYINEYLRDDDNKGKRYTLLSIFWMIPGFIGPAIGGLIYDINPILVFVFSSIFSLCTLPLLLMLPEEKINKKISDGLKESILDGFLMDDIKDFVKTNVYVKIASFVNFVLSFDGGFISTFLPLILVDYFSYDPAFVGFLFSFNTFIIFGIRIFQYKEYRKLNGKGLFLTLLFMFIFYTILPFLSGDIFVLVYILSSFPFGLIFPLAFEKFSDYLPTKHRGEIIGVNEMLKHLGSISGLILGSIIAIFNLKLGFFIIGGLYLLSAILSLKFRGVSND